MGDLLSKVFGLLIQHKVEFQEVTFIIVNKHSMQRSLNFMRCYDR